MWFKYTRQHFESPQIKYIQVKQFEQQRKLRYSVIINICYNIILWYLSAFFVEESYWNIIKL